MFIELTVIEVPVNSQLWLSECYCFTIHSFTVHELAIQLLTLWVFVLPVLELGVRATLAMGHHG
jgi:hypothetical protein